MKLGEQQNDFLNEIERLPVEFSKYQKTTNSKNHRWHTAFENGELPEKLIKERDTLRLMIAVLPELNDGKLDAQITAVNGIPPMTHRLFNKTTMRENDNGAIDSAREMLGELLEEFSPSEIENRLRKIEEEIDGVAA